MRTGIRAFIVAGLVAGLGLAVFVSPFASSDPDGLEKVAEEEGFADTATDHGLADSPLADYGVEGVEDDSVGTAVSGVIGVALTLAVGCAVFFGVRRLRRRPAAA